MIQYTYDAAGSKLKMILTEGANTTTTDYTGGFVYMNGGMSFFSSPEGRIVKNGSNFEYQYAIADHQGNTRVIFTSGTVPSDTLKATFEGGSGDDSGQFSNVSNIVPFTAANHTIGGSKVVRMNQGNAAGPGKSLKVYPGDKVDMEVYAYYENVNGYGTGNVSASTMVTAIATAFGGVSGGGGESGNIFNGINSALATTAFGLGANPGDARPAAFINYILFDQSYQVLDMGWTVVPSSANFAKQKISIPQVSVKEAGYIFVYLSYEDQSNNYVYFDDMKVWRTKSNLIQASEYYPYGMQNANSWTRENSTENNFLYNGGTELNKTSGVYDLYYRNYDPALGRFGQVDPMASRFASLTPYNYGNNDPVYFNDPLGDCSSCGRFEDNYNVMRGPHDTNDMDRMYRYSDPTGGIRARWLYATMLERGEYEKDMAADAEAVRTGNMNLEHYSEKYAFETTFYKHEPIYGMQGPIIFKSNFSTQMRGWGAEPRKIIGYNTTVTTRKHSQTGLTEESFRGWYFDSEFATQAFKFMEENSFGQQIRNNGGAKRVAIREVAAWITTEGILVQPWEGPLVDKDGNTVKGYQRNSIKDLRAYSHNTYLPFDSMGKTVKFGGEVFKILGQIHTHPLFGPSDTDLDQSLGLKYGFPIYNIHIGDIQDAFGRKFGTISAPSKDLFIK